MTDARPRRAQAEREAARAAADAFAARFAALLPHERADSLAAFLVAHPPYAAAGQRLWGLQYIDPAAFDAGFEAARAARPEHPLVQRLHGWREIRGQRQDSAKAFILGILLTKPDARDWQRMLARCELVSPTRDPLRRRAIWHAAAGAFPGGLPRVALRLQRAVSRGRPPEAERFETLLTAAVRDALRLPPAEELGGTAMRKRLAEIFALLRAARDVALVGNAPTLAGSGAGAEIDRHDLVVRCNYPPIHGFEADIGRRTDLMLLHAAKRPELARRLANSPTYPALPAVSCALGGTARDPAPSPPDGEPRPAAPPALERLVDMLCYPGKTTGLFGAVLVGLVFGKPLRLYGFDSFRPGSQGHYFGGAHAAPHHDTSYERWYLTRFLPTIRPAVTLHGSAPP